LPDIGASKDREVSEACVWTQRSLRCWIGASGTSFFTIPYATTIKHQKRKQFFSEEKNQKTFTFFAIPTIEAMAATSHVWAL
jgi:hypothetical protein